MRLLGKSRKKYHGSIMKCYRSIIKDSTMHEKVSLNSSKTLKNIAQKQVLYLGTRCPRYGQ